MNNPKRLWLSSNKTLPSLYASFCILVMLIVVHVTLNSNAAITLVGVSGYSNITIGEIADDSVVIQTIPVDDSVVSVEMQFATLERSNRGTVNVQILGMDSNTEYFNQQLSAEELEDHTYERFILSQAAEKSRDQHIAVIVTSDSAAGEAVSIWSSDLDSIPDGELTVNGAKMPGDLALQTRVKNHATVLLSVWKCVIVSLMTAIVLLAVWVIFRNKNIRYERYFSLLIFAFGLLYMVLITPLSIPDGHYHYQSSYQLSNIILHHEEEQGNASDFDYSSFVGHYNVKSAYLRIINDFLDETGNGEQVIIPQPRDINYFADFLPQAIGISLARLLNLNFLQLFFLGRLMNLLFYTACLYLAIKRIPRFKLLLGVLALFPMTLHQAASYSYDAFINGMSFLLIASILKCIWEEGMIEKKDYLWILICSALLAPAKVVYTSIVLLVWLIPRTRFPSRKKKVILCTLIMVICAVGIFVFQINSLQGIATSSVELNWEGGVNYSPSYVFQHPIGTAIIFLRTLKYSGQYYFESMIGKYLSGLTLPISSIIVWLFAFFAILATFHEEKKQVSIIQSLCFLIVAGIVTLLAMASMFFGYTSNTREMIMGVQGRYFTPIEPLLFIPCCHFTPKLKQYHSQLVVIPCVILEWITLLSVLNFTLIN